MSREESDRTDENSTENRIPESRVSEMVGKERTRADRAQADAATASARAAAAEAQLQMLQKQAQPKATPRQIADAMDAGTIENADGIELLANTIKTETAEQVRAETLAAVRAEQKSEKVKKDLARYVELVPGLGTGGSPDDLKAGAELNDLIENHGMARDSSTQLLACKNTFGSLRALESQPLPREGHTETGGRSGSGGSGDSGDPGVPSALKTRPDMKATYSERIAKGVYTGWDDPRLQREMKYVNPDMPRTLR